MVNANALIGNDANGNDGYCLAKAGAVYLVYLRDASKASLDLSDASGSFNVLWFNPREGGSLQQGSIKRVKGGRVEALGTPPSASGEDWIVVIRRK